MQQKSNVQQAGIWHIWKYMKKNKTSSTSSITKTILMAFSVVYSLSKINYLYWFISHCTIKNWRSVLISLFITHNYTFFCFNKCFNIRSNIGKGIVSLSSKVATIIVCIAASTEEECLSLSINEQEMNKNILYIEKDVFQNYRAAK